MLGILLTSTIVLSIAVIFLIIKHYTQKRCVPYQVTNLENKKQGGGCGCGCGCGNNG